VRATGSDRVIVVVNVVAAAIVAVAATVVAVSVLWGDSPEPAGAVPTTSSPPLATTRTTDTTAAEATVTTEATIPAPTAPVATEPLDVCAVATTATDRLARLDTMNSTELSAELTSLAGLVGDAAAGANLDTQADLAALSALIGRMSELLSRLEASRATASATTAERIDDVVATIPLYFRTMASAEGLTPLAPRLVSTCTLRSNGSPAAHDMFAFSEAVEALLANGLTGGPQFDGLADYQGLSGHDQRGQIASSGLIAEFDACRADPTAVAPGGNPGCDALYAACEAGDMLACNDLFYSTAVDSAYEMFGASCGNRIGAGGNYEWGGFCEGPAEP